MSPTQLAARLDRAVAPKKLLEHPFYEAWAAGTLTRGDLAFYAGQYWRQVEAFPGYLDRAAQRFDGATRGDLETNLADELDGDHQGLWLRFAEAVGASTAEITAAEPVPETRTCVDAFGAAPERSGLFALGMLYGYESQTPEVARTKASGLRDHYGIDGPAIEYFELHGELDVRHAGDLAAAIAREATSDEDLNEAEAGAAAGAEAVWTLLDGVARVTNIAT
ncbi:MAG: iron-containing redox enzyme family protein [Actinomycetota bacterium]